MLAWQRALMRRLTLPLLAASLASCASLSATRAPINSDSFCSIAKIISISQADNLTPETAREILAHDLKVQALCKG